MSALACAEGAVPVRLARDVTGTSEPRQGWGLPDREVGYHAQQQRAAWSKHTGVLALWAAKKQHRDDMGWARMLGGAKASKMLDAKE